MATVEQQLRNMAPNLIYTFLPSDLITTEIFGPSAYNIRKKREMQLDCIESAAKNSQSKFDSYKLIVRDEIIRVYGQTPEDCLTYLARTGNLPGRNENISGLAGVDWDSDELNYCTSYLYKIGDTDSNPTWDPNTGTMYVGNTKLRYEPSFRQDGTVYRYFYNSDNSIVYSARQKNNGNWKLISVSDGNGVVDLTTGRILAADKLDIWSNVANAWPVVASILTLLINLFTQKIQSSQAMSPSQYYDGWAEPYYQKSNDNAGTLLMLGLLGGGIYLLSQDDKKKNNNNQ